VQLYRALLLFAVPLSLVTGWFALIGQPYASLQVQIIEDAQEQRATQVAGLRAGRFYQQEDGRITFYAAEIDERNRLRGIFLQDRRGERPSLVLADRGTYERDADTGAERVVLEAGRRYDGTPGTAAYRLAEFDRYTYFLDNDEAGEIERRRRAAQPTRELIGSDSRRDRAELGHRLAAPLAIYSLALLAIPLTNLSPRQRGTARLLLAFLAYFAFFNLQRLAENWYETGLTPPWMGVLWYQVVIVLILYLSLAPGSFWLRQVMAPIRRRFRSRAERSDTAESLPQR
jgi:lipopolysaccharide export system permease protein